MSFFNSAVKPAKKARMYYVDPAAAASRLKAVPSTRDVVAELTQARNAYQLIVSQEVQGVGFYEELAAQVRDEGPARFHQ